jgi:ParB family chromosome partitioning protein
LLAVKELGWEEIPVYVLEDFADLRTRLLAERDENTCHKELTPREAVDLGRQLEELERPNAKERQGRRGQERSGKSPEQEEAGQSRDHVAAAVGMSGRTYEKGKAVVEAAEEDPEAFGDLPKSMDESGSVDAAYKEMRKRQWPSPARPLRVHLSTVRAPPFAAIEHEMQRLAVSEYSECSECSEYALPRGGRARARASCPPLAARNLPRKPHRTCGTSVFSRTWRKPLARACNKPRW